jgi:hypothetical protein
MRKIARLTVIAALVFMALRPAQAVEWQCGPHYVSTFVLHGWPGEEKARQCRDYHILAYPIRNRTREEVEKNDLPYDDDAEFGLPHKGFRWGREPHHPTFCILTFRGKPCFQYPIKD